MSRYSRSVAFTVRLVTRTKAVVGLLIVVALAVPAYAWWRTGENERRLDDLIEMTYEYSGFDGDADLNFLNHSRRKPGSLNCEGLDGDWYGIKAATRSDPTIDWLAGAEVAAQRFDDEGWYVERWVAGSESAPLLRVLASKGAEEVLASYFDGAISFGAAAGPCMRPGITTTSGSGRLVERFDDR